MASSFHPCGLWRTSLSIMSLRHGIFFSSLWPLEDVSLYYVPTSWHLPFILVASGGRLSLLCPYVMASSFHPCGLWRTSLCLMSLRHGIFLSSLWPLEDVSLYYVPTSWHLPFILRACGGRLSVLCPYVMASSFHPCGLWRTSLSIMSLRHGIFLSSLWPLEDVSLYYVPTSWHLPFILVASGGRLSVLCPYVMASSFHPCGLWRTSLPIMSLRHGIFLSSLWPLEDVSLYYVPTSWHLPFILVASGGRLSLLCPYVMASSFHPCSLWRTSLSIMSLRHGIFLSSLWPLEDVSLYYVPTSWHLPFILVASGGRLSVLCPYVMASSCHPCSLWRTSLSIMSLLHGIFLSSLWPLEDVSLYYVYTSWHLPFILVASGGRLSLLCPYVMASSFHPCGLWRTSLSIMSLRHGIFLSCLWSLEDVSLYYVPTSWHLPFILVASGGRLSVLCPYVMASSFHPCGLWRTSLSIMSLRHGIFLSSLWPLEDVSLYYVPTSWHLPFMLVASGGRLSLLCPYVMASSFHPCGLWRTSLSIMSLRHGIFLSCLWPLEDVSLYYVPTSWHLPFILVASGGRLSILCPYVMASSFHPCGLWRTSLPIMSLRHGIFLSSL
ncbi:hypothetical protein ACOMHN_049240 [Nucella lapillus]